MRLIHNIDDSKNFYLKLKDYFGSQELTDCVIEISEKPLPEWTIYLTESEEQMVLKRREFSTSKKPFIAIYSGNKGRYFFFTDYKLTQLEILNTGEIILFNIEDFRSYSLEQVKKELLKLKKMPQGA